MVNYTQWVGYTNTIIFSITNRGYTTHEHLADYGVINMNGRLYDPIAARMMNADPFIANPNSAQDYNRYSYVRNNPLKYQDPTGFMGVGMQRTYHYRIVDFAAINGKLATDSHDAILQMKMMGHKGVESQYLEALLWAEQSEGGDGSGSQGLGVNPSYDIIMYLIISSYLESNIAKGAFANYWWGGDNINLSTNQFLEIVKLIESGEAEVVGDRGAFEKYPDYQIFEVDFYNTSLEQVLGKAYIIQSKESGKYIGFFDTYDFEKSLRPAEADQNTTYVRWASFFSSYSNPYYITYWAL
jgi:RHS repeat-associated protein